MGDGGWGMKEREMTGEIHPSSLRPHPSCKLVGARGFEPPTPCSQSRCATRLRYTPTLKRQCVNRLPETAIPRAKPPSLFPDRHAVVAAWIPIAVPWPDRE